MMMLLVVVGDGGGDGDDDVELPRFCGATCVHPRPHSCDRGMSGNQPRQETDPLYPLRISSIKR